ncbi:MAG TPA: DUF4982 domain-containing protein, partial [Verrucomicrobiae bacterium]
TVELLVNGQSLGRTNRPCEFVDTFSGEEKDFGNTGYIYAFPDVKFVPGVIEARGTANDGVVVADQIQTAGEPAQIKLTAHTGPGGLQADGSDVAFVDFEVVDTNGLQCPTDEARVDFKLTGPAIWRGGYDSGITNSVNHLYLDTECGINRVAIRSTLQPGAITLTASRPGLESATIQIQAHAVKIEDGLELKE